MLYLEEVHPCQFIKTLSAFNIKWERINFYLVDERCVPLSSKESNYNNISDCFFKLIPSGCFSMVQDQLTYKEAIKQYETLIRKNLSCVNGLPQFDLIVLGMGLDGHTASLFPNTKALSNNQDLVVLNKVPKLKTNRITMTYPLILNAKKIILLIKGKEKKEVFSNSIKNSTPISLIIPNIDYIIS